MGGGEFIKHMQNFEKNNIQEKGAKSAESVRHSFIVMQKLGLNLSQILNMRNQRFSLKTVCQVGHRLVTILEKLHSIGKIYNDLKLENIIVGDGECSKPSMSHIRLIDFGLCTDYLDKDGSHIKFGYTKEFIGNMALSSKYAMGFHTVGRRDDMIQLSYLLIYMIQGDLDFLKYVRTETNPHKIFKKISRQKSMQTPEDICKSEAASVFLNFVKSIHSIEFE